MDEQHPRPAGEHEPRVTFGFDGGSDGRGVVWVQPLDGGAWSDVGYLTSDGLAYTEEQPQTEVLWDAAARGGKTSTTGRASYDKTPEATRRRAAVWTDRSWLNIDQVVNDFLAQEERRLRDWRSREELHHTEQGEHPVIDGECVEWPPIVADWEERYRLVNHHIHRALSAGAAGAYERMRAVSQTNWPGVVLTTVVSVPDGLADPAVRLYLGLPPLPFDDTLGRWEDDGGR